MTVVWILSYFAVYLLGGISVAAVICLAIQNETKKTAAMLADELAYGPLPSVEHTGVNPLK